MLAEIPDQDAYDLVDKALASFFGQQINADDDASRWIVEQTIGKLSEKMRSGHTCLMVNDEQAQVLLNSTLVSDGTMVKPLVFCHQRLYFYRYWQYEQVIAQSIKNLIKNGQPLYADHQVQALLDRLFPEKQDEIDWQRQAVEQSLGRRFSIITGGPGTGKTTTVIKLLCAYNGLGDPQSAWRIALAAPTGKAASRLQSSLLQGKHKLSEDFPELVHNIPDMVSTIHQLLKPKYFSPYFHYNANKKLPYDIVLIDEASMVDVPLMAKLLQALDEQTRIILIGDKHQLTSVEVGSLMSDMTVALPEVTSELKKTYRFSGVIKAFAEAVNAQDSRRVLDILNNGDSQTIERLRYAQTTDEFIYQQYACFLKVANNCDDISAVFRAFNQFQVLCSNYHGPYGVERINALIENRYRSELNIDSGAHWYVGKPIIITQNVNNATVQLNNGDIGICLCDPHGRHYLYFEGQNGHFKRYAPAKIPHYQTAFALSIHKSQGSEFEHVVIALAQTMNPIMTKELLYTGITRTRESIKIIEEDQIIAGMCQQKVYRHGGLIQALQTSSQDD